MTIQVPIDVSLDPWSTAMPDWEVRIRSGLSLLPKLPLHDGYAEKALRIFKRLRVPDIEGYPTYGEICGDWVFDLVRIIFGSYDPEIQKRFLREFFVLIPKKNGKSSISAAIIVVAAILNERPDAELLLIAPTMRIANISFKQAAGIIRLTEGICDLFTCHENIKTIKTVSERVPSQIMIKAADADVITGSKATYILIDETHVFATRPRAKGIFVEIRGGLSSPRNKGFLLQITTQSKTAPQGVFKSELDTARAVRDGKISLPMLPLLYELPPDMVAANGWKDPKTWAMVNPHLGRSVDQGYLSDELRKAEADGPESLALTASQHFNVQIGTGQWGDGWAAQIYWEDATIPAFSLEDLLERSEVCTIGVDGGGDDDLCGLVVLGREKVTQRWLAWCRAWAQPRVLEVRKNIAPALLDFQRDGDLVICDAAFQHVLEVVDTCDQVRTSGLLPAKGGIGLDQCGLPELETELGKAGFESPQMEGVPQGWRLQGAIKSIPLRLKAQLLQHGPQPLFAWSIGNAKTELKGSNTYMTKQLAGAAKIDVIIGLLNAAILMNDNPIAEGKGMNDYFDALRASA